MEQPFDNYEFGPLSRSRSNTWPRLTRSPEIRPPTPQGSLPDHDNAPSAGPPGPSGLRGMEVIVEQAADADNATSAAPAGNSKQPPQTTKARNAWGNASYADLIAQAISSSLDKRLTLSQIYRWLEENVSYFRSPSGSGASGSAGWKNSVRHNLSLLDRFVRVPNEDKGQSSWWTVDPDAKPGRGSRTRRRAASMETSKMNEQRRGRVLERVKAMRRAKQPQQSEETPPAAPTCPAEQLANNIGMYMALGESSSSCPVYLPQPQPYHVRPQAGESLLQGYHADVAIPSYRNRCSRPPSPPRYQQLPTILLSASGHPAFAYELPTVLPPPSSPTFPAPSVYQQLRYQPPPQPSPPNYQCQPPLQPSPPNYQCQPPLQPSPPNYQCQPSCQAQCQPPFQVSCQPPCQAPCQPPCLCQPPSQAQCQPPYQRSLQQQTCEPSSTDDLTLSFSLDAGLNCDVDAVLRQELFLEGNLDFNFSQPGPRPNPQYVVPYGVPCGGPYVASSQYLVL